jgi:hypothetical protein
MVQMDESELFPFYYIDPNENMYTCNSELAGPEGFEPSANGLRGHRSNLAELRTPPTNPYHQTKFKSFMTTETHSNKKRPPTNDGIEDALKELNTTILQ